MEGLVMTNANLPQLLEDVKQKLADEDLNVDTIVITTIGTKRSQKYKADIFYFEQKGEQRWLNM